MPIEASPQSICNLITTSGKSISVSSKTIESTIVIYELCLDRLKDSQFSENKHLLKLKVLSEVILTYSFADVELATLIRADLKERDDNFYRKTVLLQTYRVLSESTKALFGFGKDKKNAFWTKLCVIFDLSGFTDEIREIESGIDELFGNVIKKNYRDIASHYNWDAIEVSDSYSDIIDEDLVLKDLNRYEYIIERVSKISSQLLYSLDTDGFANVNTNSQCFSSKISSSVLIWHNEKSILKPKLVEVIKSSYHGNAQQLEQNVRLCRSCRQLLEMSETIKNNEAIHCYLKILNSICLLLFMMNDALAAAVALTDSESFWESRMNLKRLDISAYEALNKVAGIANDSKERCMFSEIDHVIDDLPLSEQKQYEIIKNDTNDIIKRYEFDKMGPRNSFVHYRSSNEAWLMQTYNNMINISAPKALIKVLELRNLTTKIVHFVDSFTNAFSVLQNKKFAESINQMFQPLIDLVAGMNNNEAKEKSFRVLDEVQKQLLTFPTISEERFV